MPSGSTVVLRCSLVFSWSIAPYAVVTPASSRGGGLERVMNAPRDCWRMTGGLGWRVGGGENLIMRGRGMALW